MKRYRSVLILLVGVFLLGSLGVQPALAQFRDLETGSFLVFPLFDISAGGGRENTTTLRITNTHPFIDVSVKVSYICGGSVSSPTSQAQCLESDQRFTVTHRGSRIFDVDDPTFLPQCTRGFAIAYAELPNPAIGVYQPISFNQLYGDAQIIYAVPNANNNLDTTAEIYHAIAFQSPQPQGAFLGLFDNADTGALFLGFGAPITGTINGLAVVETGTDYNALPAYLYATFPVIGADISSNYPLNVTGPGPFAGADPAYKNVDTKLIVLSLGINLGVNGGFNPAVLTTMQVWDQLERSKSQGSPFFACFYSQTITATVPLASSPAAFTADYGNLRLTTGITGVGILGAIEEVSNLTTTSTVGTTIHPMWHAGIKSAPTRFISQPNP